MPKRAKPPLCFPLFPNAQKTDKRLQMTDRYTAAAAASADPIHSTQTASAAAWCKPGLFLFALVYGGMCILGSFIGNKQVALGPLAVEAGIFSFLLLVVLASATSELYGSATANRLVVWGFVPLIMAMAIVALVLALPAAHDMDKGRLDAFNTILGQSPRLMIAGLIAYGISQLLNVTIFNALRGKTGEGKMVAVRGAIASVLSQVIDTLLFISISFYGVFPIKELLIGQMIAKVVLSIVLVPFLITGAIKLARWLDARHPSVQGTFE